MNVKFEELDGEFQNDLFIKGTLKTKEKKKYAVEQLSDKEQKISWEGSPIYIIRTPKKID